MMHKEKIYADLDEIVFEGREKDYGAYQMRRRYNRVLTRATLVAFLLFLCVTGLPKMIKWFTPTQAIVIPEEPTITMIFDEIDIPDIKEEPEEPIMPPLREKPKPAPEIKKVEFRVIEPSQDDFEEDASIIDTEELDPNALLSFETTDGEDYDGTNVDFNELIGEGPGGPDEVQPFEEEDPDVGQIFGGEPPRPINMQELKNIIGYPERAKEAGVEGKVTVRVLVDKMGKYKKHVVLKSPHNLLTKPVEKQLKRLIFTPGIQNNRPVPVWVTIPFDFVLTTK